MRHEKRLKTPCKQIQLETTFAKLIKKDTWLSNCCRSTRSCNSSNLYRFTLPMLLTGNKRRVLEGFSASKRSWAIPGRSVSDRGLPAKGRKLPGSCSRNSGCHWYTYPAISSKLHALTSIRYATRGWVQTADSHWNFQLFKFETNVF